MPAFYILLLTIFLCADSGAQGTKKKVHAVSAGPVILSPGLIGMQAGFEFTTQRDLRWLGEIAIPVLNPDRFRQSFQPDVYRFTIEARFEPGHYTNYIGIQAGYLHRKFNDRDSGYFVRQPKDKGGFVYQNAVINSPVYFAVFKLGTLEYLGSGFYADAFMGLGGRFIFTEVNGRQVSAATYPEMRSPINILPAWRCDCNLIRLQLNAGVRFLKYF